MSNPEMGKINDIHGELSAGGSFRQTSDAPPRRPERGIISPATVTRIPETMRVRSPNRATAVAHRRVAAFPIEDSSPEIHIHLGDPTEPTTDVPAEAQAIIVDVYEGDLNDIEIKKTEGEGAGEALSTYQKRLLRSYPVFTADQTRFLVAARDQDVAEATYVDNGVQPLPPEARVRELRHHQIFPQPQTSELEVVRQYDKAFRTSTTVENLIVIGNARLPLYFSAINAKKYDISYKELVSVGQIGLEKAAHAYDASKGASFSYFTGLKIWGEWSLYLRKRNAAYHSSKAVADLTGKVQAADKIFEQKHGRKPDGEELSTFILEAPNGAPYASKSEKPPTPESIRQAVAEHLQPITVGSIDGTADSGESGSSAEILSDSGSDFAEQIELQSALKEAFDRLGLDERQRNVLHMSVIEGRGPVEIGNALGITRNAVTRAKSNALAKLRKDPSLLALWSGE